MAIGNSINEQTIGICGFTGTSFTGSPATQFNIQVGGATSSTLASVAPSATSGVPLISQGAASNPAFGTAVVQGGGTGATTLTNHGVLIGKATSAIVATAVGSAGQVLQSGGASADPIYSTATYPSTAGTTGNVLTSDGTNWNSSAPATSGTVTSVSGTANQVAVATGTTTPVISLIGPYTPATYTSHGVLIGEGTSSIAATSAGSAGQVLQSGGASADPTWTTATFPSTATGTGKVLIANGTNWVDSTPTFPNASASSGKFIQSDGTNWIASTPTLPTSAGTSGKVLQSNGTNYVESTPTYPSASGSAGKILRSDGTNNVYSTATFPDTAGTSGNVLTSDGTNWTSAASSSTKSFSSSVTAGNGNPADSTTYYLANADVLTISTVSNKIQARIYIPYTCTITKVIGSFRVIGTLGSTENCTLFLRLNDTTNTNITTTLQLSSSENPINNTSLSIAVSAGDYLSFGFTCPAWVTNPTNVGVSLIVSTN